MTTPKTRAEQGENGRLIGSLGDPCAEGTHDLGKPPHARTNGRVCKKCGMAGQSVYTCHHDLGFDAQLGDFRVVCREPECDFGRAVDADGHGYTNHTSMLMARAALLAHQKDHGDEEMHDASIQEHPIDAVIAADIERKETHP